MNIAVIGAGYVGVTTSIAFAEHGYHVYVVDTDAEKRTKLAQANLPFYEEGMEELLQKHVEHQRLEITNHMMEVVGKSELIFIAVGTPSLPSGAVNLEYIEQVSREIGKCLQEYRLIVVKSTVPIGTGEKIKSIIQEELQHRKKEIEFDVVSNPEFLREGNAIHDALNPDRIVVGCETQRARALMEQLYHYSSAPILFTKRKEAEMIKYASNAFLATKISFINELAKVSERLGVNISTIAEGMGMDERIGSHFLRAGLGYGGSCFPKDTSALMAISIEAGVPLTILEAVAKVNETQVHWFIEKMTRALGSLEGKHIAILGLTFKPNTDDIREAISLKLIARLLSQHVVISAYDPKGIDAVKKIFPQVRYTDGPLEALNGVDATILVTEWEEIVQLDWRAARKRVRQPFLFDGRNVLNPKKMEESGFWYEGVGRVGKEVLHG